MARKGTKIKTGVAAPCRLVASTSGFALLEAIALPAEVALAGIGVLTFARVKKLQIRVRVAGKGPDSP